MELRERLYKELREGVEYALLGSTIARKLGISEEELLELIEEERKNGNLIFDVDGEQFYIPTYIDVEHHIEKLREEIREYNTFEVGIAKTMRGVRDTVRKKEEQLARLVLWMSEDRPAVKAKIRGSVL